MFSTLFISSRTNLSSPGYESLQMKVTVKVSDVPVKQSYLLLVYSRIFKLKFKLTLNFNIF